MSRSGSGKPDQDLEVVELLFHQKGGLPSFGTKMMLSLNRVDLSYMNSITGSTHMLYYLKMFIIRNTVT